MPIFYKELTVGATGYPASGPSMVWGASALTGPNVGDQPDIHMFRAMGGSGSDVFVSFDGKTDHQRIVAADAPNIIAPYVSLELPYQKVWARSAAGVTGPLGMCMYTRK